MRQSYFKELLERSKANKAVALALITACLKEKAATVDEIRAYMVVHIREKPSGTAFGHVAEHPTDDQLIRVLLDSLVSQGQAVEREGVFSIPPPHTLDSEWSW